MSRRFEIKKEMSDGVKIRPYAHENEHKIETEELIEEVNRVGFDDFAEDIEVEPKKENIEIRLDENGNPVLPKGWTYLVHGSSKDKWDASVLENDFVVGRGTIRGQQAVSRPLCCVERSVAKFDYERSGCNTANSYGGKQQAFEIRVLFYDNPKTGAGKVVREKLSDDKLKDVTKYYMYQGGRHPAVPSGTKLTFIKNGNFDDITNTNGNDILWYIPEEYLQEYLEDVQQMQTQNKVIDDEKSPNEETTGETAITDETMNNEVNDMSVKATNADVEKELDEYYDEDISSEYVRAYLEDKLLQIYGDKLSKTGIDLKRFLNDKVDRFNGSESYREIVEELELMFKIAADNVVLKSGIEATEASIAMSEIDEARDYLQIPQTRMNEEGLEI